MKAIITPYWFKYNKLNQIVNANTILHFLSNFTLFWHIIWNYPNEQIYGSITASHFLKYVLDFDEPKKAHQETITFTNYLNYQKELFLCKVIQNMDFFNFNLHLKWDCFNKFCFSNSSKYSVIKGWSCRRSSDVKESSTGRGVKKLNHSNNDASVKGMFLFFGMV